MSNFLMLSVAFFMCYYFECKNKAFIITVEAESQQHNILETS